MLPVLFFHKNRWRYRRGIKPIYGVNVKCKRNVKEKNSLNLCLILLQISVKIVLKMA